MRRFKVVDVFEKNPDDTEDLLRYVVLDTHRGDMVFAAFVQENHARWFCRCMNNFEWLYVPPIPRA